MRKSVLYFFFLFVISVNAQETLTPDKKNVQQSVIGFFQGIANRDTSAMLSYCTNDILVLEGGLLWPRDTLKIKIAQNTAPDYNRINTIEFINTTVKGKIAWVSYYNQAEVTKYGKHSFVKWLETVILVKENKTWKIKVLHSSVMWRKD